MQTCGVDGKKNVLMGSRCSREVTMTAYQWISLIPGCILAAAAVTALVLQIRREKKQAHREEE